MLALAVSVFLQSVFPKLNAVMLKMDRIDLQSHLIGLKLSTHIESEFVSLECIQHLHWLLYWMCRKITYAICFNNLFMCLVVYTVSLRFLPTFKYCAIPCVVIWTIQWNPLHKCCRSSKQFFVKWLRSFESMRQNRKIFLSNSKVASHSYELLTGWHKRITNIDFNVLCLDDYVHDTQFVTNCDIIQTVWHMHVSITMI